MRSKTAQINSRTKGKTGELQLAQYLRERGFEAKRGQQHAGGPDSPDVVSSVPGVHIECKRVERGSVDEWLKQAIKDAKNGKMPVVMHRRNKTEWKATLRLDDFLALIKLAYPPIEW